MIHANHPTLPLLPVETTINCMKKYNITDKYHMADKYSSSIISLRLLLFRSCTRIFHHAQNLTALSMMYLDLM